MSQPTLVHEHRASNQKNIQERSPRPMEWLPMYGILSLLAGVELLLAVYPDRPTAWLGWRLLCVVVLPVLLVGERVGEKPWNNPLRRRVETRMRG